MNRTFPITAASLALFAALCLVQCNGNRQEDDLAIEAAIARPTPSYFADTQDLDTSQTRPLRVSLEPVVGGVIRPTFVTAAPGAPELLFIVEKIGRIMIYHREGTTGTLLAEPFLDIVPRVASVELEQGMCGLAFHPDYEKNGRFFVHYTDTSSTVIVAEFARSASDPLKADPVAKQVIISEPHSIPTHNGGMLAFGPDGYFYASLGDGGCCDDPLKNAQNINTLLGKILRIDVNKGTPYSCPPDNPFAGRTPGRDEIFCYGLRNPYRFSFDRKDGRIFCGDAGRLQREEVDVIVKGGNYGWPILEGDICYVAPGQPLTDKCSRAGKIMPVSVYDHQKGDCCIIGGYVYRGKSVPELNGRYVFGDYCSGMIWALEEKPGEKWGRRLIFNAPFMVSSFGEDHEGELYVCEYVDMNQPVSRIFRVVPAGAATGIRMDETTQTKPVPNWEDLVTTK